MSKKDITQEIEEVATKLEKSAKTEQEILFDTIKELGPEGLRKALPTLDKEEQELLLETLADMKKAVSMDDAYSAKMTQGKITDTKIQEEVANDDADEKLVKPEAAKQNHQGTPVEGWEGQVIKANGDMSKEKAKSELMKLEEKEHGTNNPKKLVEAEKEEQAEKKMKKSEDQMKKCSCGKPAAEGLKKCMGCMKAMKKSIELELGDKATPELVKAEMKSRLLAEESQLGDAPEMKESTRANKGDVKPLDLSKDNESAQSKVNDLGQGQEGSMSKAKAPKELDLEDDNKEAQKKVNDLKQGKEEKVKKAVWGSENDLLKARTGGRNHHFSVNGYYDEVTEAAKNPLDTKLTKSEEPKKEDLNDIIAKGGDATWGQIENDRLVKANGDKVSGKFTKSFVDADLAEAFNMTQEELKKIIGEE